ncbi:MAG: cupin domain-containing protein [Caldilineae bacterium]|nr:MAG: cupin domain-containing protein [Caldilineae bacterium]
MSTAYLFLPDLLAEVPDIPGDSILSRTLFQDDRLKVVLFAFAGGQELSEHTAARPAVLHFLSGEATVTLGEDTFQAQAGSWAHMPPHLPHSIRAHSDTVMLLLML